MEYVLFEAEYKLMDMIWDNEPIKSGDLCKKCLEAFGWKKSTTYTMLRKLSDRNILINENAVVHSVLKKETVQMCESNELIRQKFNNSLPQFIAAFLKNNKLTQKQIDELKRIIEEADADE